MKCPNCSFNNPKSAEICKVCGFELQHEPTVDTPQERRPPDNPPPRKHLRDDSGDAELDSTLKTLFGGQDDSQEMSYDSHLDDSEEEAYDSPNKSPFWILGILVGIGLILFILFKILTPNDSNPEAEIPSDITETPIVVPKNKTSEDQVNQFFTLLPTFVNQGNIAILNLFKDSNASLDQLTSYSKQGTFEDLNHFELIPIDETDTTATYQVNTLVDRILDEESFTESYKWYFEVAKIEGQWLIGTFNGAEQTGQPQETEPAPETTAAPTSAAHTTQVQTSAEPTEAPTTEGSTQRPDGFVSQGSFSGGSITDGQDIYSVRYGLHETFERLVFDIYAWTGSEPTEAVDEVGAYEASVSDNGKVLTILVEGARGAFASRKSVDLPNISSLEYFYPGSDSAVGIRITLSGEGAFKVFSIKEPARLIVDYYVN